MSHRDRQIRYAVKRRLCWSCFVPLEQKVTAYVFRCPKCEAEYPAAVQFEREEKWGRRGEGTV